MLIAMMAFGGTDVGSYASRCISFSGKDDLFVFGGGDREFPSRRAREAVKRGARSQKGTALDMVWAGGVPSR